MTADPYRATAKGANNPSDPGSWNRYAYVGNDPVNRYDPWGLDQCPPENPCPMPPPTDDPNGPGGSQGNRSGVKMPRGGEGPHPRILPIGFAGALKDLGKPKCATFFGFSSPEAAQSYFGTIDFKTGHLGPLKVENAPDGGIVTVGEDQNPPAVSQGSIFEPGPKTITVNYDYNWINFNSVSALNVTTGKIQSFNYLGAINATWDMNMTTYQFSALILLHEFDHILGAPQDTFADAKEFNESIYNNCIK